MAATLVLQNHAAEPMVSVNTGAYEVVSQVIAEAVILTILLIIIISINVSAAASSS